MTKKLESFNEKQLEANRIESQFDTLKDRVIKAEHTNQYSDEEIADMRAEMKALSNQYFDLTNLTLS